MKDELSSVMVGAEGLSGKELAVKNPAAKSLVQQHNQKNDQCTNLSMREVQIKDELKALQLEIKSKTEKLTEKKKDLKQELLTIGKKKLFIFGEVNTLRNQLKEFGYKVKEIDIKSLLISERKEK